MISTLTIYSSYLPFLIDLSSTIMALHDICVQDPIFCWFFYDHGGTPNFVGNITLGPINHMCTLNILFIVRWYFFVTMVTVLMTLGLQVLSSPLYKYFETSTS